MLKLIEEQINRGSLLIEKAKVTGKDIEPIINRVEKLKRNLNEQLQNEESEKDLDNSENVPDWYTEEDRKAKLVLEGRCKSCFHLWFVNSDMDNRCFKGFWCQTFKKKLSNKIENCQGFLSNSEGLDQLIAKMKAEGELPEWVGR